MRILMAGLDYLEGPSFTNPTIISIEFPHRPLPAAVIIANTRFVIHNHDAYYNNTGWDGSEYLMGRKVLLSLATCEGALLLDLCSWDGNKYCSHLGQEKGVQTFTFMD